MTEHDPRALNILMQRTAKRNAAAVRLEREQEAARVRKQNRARGTVVAKPQEEIDDTPRP